MDDAVVQAESACAAPGVFSSLKTASRDILLDLTPEKPPKRRDQKVKGKELSRQKRQEDLVKKDARNKEIRPRLTQKEYDHMVRCVKDHDELVASKSSARLESPKAKGEDIESFGYQTYRMFADKPP